MGEHGKRDVARTGPGGDPAQLAAHLRRQRGPSACGRAVRPGDAARLPRPLRRRRRAAAGGAAARPGGARLRPEPGGGAHQQGDDRDPAQVRGPAAGEPGGPGGADGPRRVARGDGPRGGCALLRQVDARGGFEADRALVSESRGDGGDGGGASGPRAVCGAEADGDRVAVGTHGAQSESGLRRRGGATGEFVRAVVEEGQGGVRRAGRRGAWVPVRGEGGDTASGGEARNKAIPRIPLPLSDVRVSNSPRLREGRGRGQTDGHAPDGGRCRRRPRSSVPRSKQGNRGYRPRGRT